MLIVTNGKETYQFRNFGKNHEVFKIIGSQILIPKTLFEVQVGEWTVKRERGRVGRKNSQIKTIDKSIRMPCSLYAAYEARYPDIRERNKAIVNAIEKCKP